MQSRKSWGICSPVGRDRNHPCGNASPLVQKLARGLRAGMLGTVLQLSRHTPSSKLQKL